MISALPSARPERTQNGSPAPVWWGRRSCMIEADTDGVSMELALAHVELQQRPCCIVREGPRGPRGGRGKLEYNSTPAWPAHWLPNKFLRYYIVEGEPAVSAADQRQLDKALALGTMYGTGAIKTTIDPSGQPQVTAVAPSNLFQSIIKRVVP